MIRILLIEACETEAVAIEEALARKGIELTIVPDVPEGSIRGYHVILTDLCLANTSGVGTIKAIRLLSPVTPIIVLTGNQNVALHQDCLTAGASLIFVKGEQVPGSLLRSIRSVIHVSEHKLESVKRLLSRAELLLH